MKYKKIIYLYNSRIPTEKANGYQTFKTCESLITQNTKVEIWCPTRYNFKNLENIKPSEYYNLIYTPTIKKIPSLDIINLFNRVNSKSFSLIYKKITSLLLLLSFSLGIVIKILFERNSADIFYTRDPNIAAIILFFLPNLKSRIFIELHTLSQNKRNFKRQIKILKNIKGIITLTKYMRNELIKNGVYKNKIIFAHDAVDLKLFKNKITKKSARKKLSIPSNKYIIMYVGKFYTLGEEKGIPEILKSLKYLKIPNLLIYFIGGPVNDLTKYKNIILSNKLNSYKIKFLDHQSKSSISLWLKSADVLLMPFPRTNHYMKYASPLKLFEYMCSKNPIVATNLISTKEILSHKKNSLLVKPNSPIEIAKAINLLYLNKELALKISKNSYQEVENYTWEKRSLKILNFISKLQN